jgi:hypothetical protein
MKYSKIKAGLKSSGDEKFSDNEANPVEQSLCVSQEAFSAEVCFVHFGKEEKEQSSFPKA